MLQRNIKLTSRHTFRSLSSDDRNLCLGSGNPIANGGRLAKTEMAKRRSRHSRDGAIGKQKSVPSLVRRRPSALGRKERLSRMIRAERPRYGNGIAAAKETAELRFDPPASVGAFRPTVRATLYLFTGRCGRRRCSIIKEGKVQNRHRLGMFDQPTQATSSCRYARSCELGRGAFFKTNQFQKCLCRTS
jgi:hypothetical protein